MIWSRPSFSQACSHGGRSRGGRFGFAFAFFALAVKGTTPGCGTRSAPTLPFAGWTIFGFRRSPNSLLIAYSRELNGLGPGGVRLFMKAKSSSVVRRAARSCSRRSSCVAVSVSPKLRHVIFGHLAGFRVWLRIGASSPVWRS